MVLQYGRAAAKAGLNYSKKAIRASFLAGMVTSIAGSAFLYSTHRAPEVVTASKSSPPLTMSIRVMTANIAGGIGREHRFLDFFADIFYDQKIAEGTPLLEAIIRGEQIDIACFQEMEHSYIIGENQPARIADNTQLQNYAYGQNFTFDLFGKFFANGNSIHSTTQLFDVKRIPQQKHTPFGWAQITKPFVGSKSYTTAKVNVQGNELHEINVFCAHMSAKQWTMDRFRSEKGREREYEMLQLMELAAHNTPAIVLGDINTVPLGSRHIKYYPGRKNYLGERTWEVAEEVAKTHGVQIQAAPQLHLFDRDTPHELPATYIGRATGRFGKPLEKDAPYRKVIDFVFLVTHPDDPIQLTLKDTRVVHYSIVSDHAPVIADIEVIEK